jgi:uncharacterized protein
LELFSTYPPAAWMILLAAGAFIGLLSGLLGIGGGIVAVPVLLDLFTALGMSDEVATPLAIGTAQANVLIASLAAIVAHRRAGMIDRSLVRAWLPGVVIGAAAGIALGPHAPARLLTGIFAIVAAGLALKLAVGQRFVLAHAQPSGAAAQVAPILVGGLAAALGVGGGTLSTPVLTLFSFPIRRAIGAGALFNLVIALPATLAFLSTGWSVAGRPADCVGNVALACAAALSLPALIIAPLAAHWSTRVPMAFLRRSFALCLGAIAIHLLVHH